MKQTWQGLSIRHKVLSIIVFTLLLVAITLFPAVSRLTKEALEHQQREHLLSVKNLVTRLFEDYQRKVTNYTRLFSNDREIKDSLFYYTELAGEREHPLRAVTRLFQSFDVNSIEIGDSRGRAVAAAEAPDKYDSDRSADPLIQKALHGDVASGIVLTEKRFVIRASAPIHYNENQIIGTITSGIPLDDALLSKIKELSKTDLVITDIEGNPVSSTLKPEEPSDLNELKPDRLASNHHHLVTTFPLSDVTGVAVGTVTILQENRLPGILARTHMTLTAILVTISVVSALFLFVTFRKLMQPIVRLKEGVERIGRGELSHRILVETSDEIGELSDGFNRMAQNLEGLRNMEERLNRSERLAAIGTFAAGIAHEINNPIGNVIGLARLVRKSATTAEMVEDIDMIVRNAERCARITKDLLTYSRQSPPRRETVLLASLIDDSLKNIRTIAGRKQVQIVTELHDETMVLFVDPLQIDQALTNILLNAVQSIDHDGVVSIQTSVADREMVEIAVSDTGCGIGEKDKDKIFYPFFTTKPVGEGTGLGLAISYGIVRNHGGDITVDTRQGAGSTFRIRLPMGEMNG